MLASDDRLLAAEQQQAEAMAELLDRETAYANAVVMSKIYKERIEGLQMQLKADFLRRGESASAATILSEADPRYTAGMKRIVSDLQDAQAVIVRFDLLKEKLNCAREIMANERKRMGL
jgi:hypothetical protein